jgi:hypothetical protein
MVLSGRSRQFVLAMTTTVQIPELKDRIATVLGGTPYRPWCVHRLYEDLLASEGPHVRDDMLRLTQQAADDLVSEGRAQREFVSAIGIGVHCEDSLYWSRDSTNRTLAEFGPEYESPTVLRRLASHFQCRGL